MLFLLIIAFYFQECCSSIINCNIRGPIKVLNSGMSPVKRGRDLYLNISLLSPFIIDDASVTYSTRYNYLPVYRFAEELDVVPVGRFKKSLVYSIPSYTLGNINVKIQWDSPRYGNLLCLEIEENVI